MKLTKDTFETIRPKVAGPFQAEAIPPKDSHLTGTGLSIENSVKGIVALCVIAIVLTITWMMPSNQQTDSGLTALHSPNYCCATIVAEISSR